MGRHIVSVGEVDLAVVEEGKGPPVVLLHGFPELAYSWRWQLPALAAAGCRVIAFDQRGYGASSKPDDVAVYGIEQLVGDVVGLLDELGIDEVGLVGHDWGGIVMWSTGVMHPERVSRLASLNVAYRGWCAGHPPIETMRERAADRYAYILSFQEPGGAETAFATSPEQWLRVIYMAAAGDPEFMSDDDFAVYLDAFQEGGVSGPVSYYRNIDANAAATAHLAHRTIVQPTLMLTADRDPILPARFADGMDRWVPDLRTTAITECGHWMQQEQPERVNEALVAFFGGG